MPIYTALEFVILSIFFIYLFDKSRKWMVFVPIGTALIILNSVFIFVFDMKAVSVALATSVSAIFNFLILYYFLQNKTTQIKMFEKENYLSFFKRCGVPVNSIMVAFSY